MVYDCFHMWELIFGDIHDLENTKIGLVILVQGLERGVVANTVE